MADYVLNPRYWFGPRARLVKLAAQKSAHAALTSINPVLGGVNIEPTLDLEDTALHASSTDVSPSRTWIDPGEAYDVAVSEGASGDHNLSATLVFVLE
jgi:hypothetical protein